MDTALSTRSSTSGVAPRNSSFLKVATIGALVATTTNVVVWLGGRAADVGFVVDLHAGETTTLQVGVILVVVTTLLAFAVGVGLLVPAARRSRRWARAVLTTAAVVAVVSAAGPLSAAHDTATGLLLAAMHVTTGTVFLVTASRMRAQWMASTAAARSSKVR
jgi:Family of unknown function (DUF6069)